MYFNRVHNGHDKLNVSPRRCFGAHNLARLLSLSVFVTSPFTVREIVTDLPKMESRLGRLSINHETRKDKVTPKEKSKEAVADSWDDEAASNTSDTEGDSTAPSSKSPTPIAPPPTPASPHSGFPSWDSPDQLPLSTRMGDRASDDRKRPEKSTAVAGRLIAAGLGMRAPKQTEEQKAYDRAIRENEIKRRKKEKEEKDKGVLENEKAQTVMWES